MNIIVNFDFDRSFSTSFLSFTQVYLSIVNAATVKTLTFKKKLNLIWKFKLLEKLILIQYSFQNIKI